MIYLYVLLSLVSITSRSYYTYADQYTKLERGQELILCRKCGADVADSNYLFNKSSPGARKVEKQNLFGRQNVTVQTLVNPFGVKFDIVTTEKARCDNSGPSQGADSWFPGYTWRICTCPHCGQHLGWTFTRLDSAGDNKSDHMHSFSGLILTNVLGENFTDSLIMMPKMYKM